MDDGLPPGVLKKLAMVGLFLLAVLLLVGGVIGAQFGARIGMRLKAEQLRVALAGMVLMVCFKLAFDLVARPAELFSIAGATG